MLRVNLLPHPRELKRQPGFYSLPQRAVLYLEPGLPRDTVLLPIAERLQSAAEEAGVQLEFVTGPTKHPRLAISALRSGAAPAQPAGYALTINARGILIHYRQEGGLRAAVATLRQLFREHGRRLPFLTIRDYADFPRRGVMLDISRGRVPNLQTLLDLAEHLADFLKLP